MTGSRRIGFPANPAAHVAPVEVGPGLVSQVARLSLWQEATSLLRKQMPRQDAPRHDPPLDTDGLPVLLVGGMASTERMLSPLREWLYRLNCRCLAAPVRNGFGCSELTARQVEQALERLADATGQTALVIGHSRGGQLARAVAVRRPDLCRGLITLGSPLVRPLAVHPLLLANVAVLGLVGSLGMPGLMRASCLWGECCARFRADLHDRFPTHVPFISVYARQDQLVDWRSTLDPAARHRSVPTTHGGLLWSAESLSAVTEEIATLLDDPPAAAAHGSTNPPAA